MVFCFAACGKEDESGASAENGGIAIQVEKVVSADISTENKVSGKVISSSDNSVYVPSSVLCTSVLVSDGSKVKAGDRLAKLDLSTMETLSDDQNLAFDQVTLLNKQVELAKGNYDATRALYSIGAASKAELDNAEITYLGAKAQLDNNLSSLGMTLQSVAMQSSRKASSENIDEEGYLVAPCDGTVISITASKNSTLSPKFPVAVIQGSEHTEIAVSVSEALLPKLSVGDDAGVAISSADVYFTGKIKSIDQNSNMQTKLYSVSVTVPDDVTGLVSGMFADVSFYTDSSENAITVPSEAVLSSDTGSYVYLVKDGFAKKSMVETGLISGGRTEIISGVVSGDIVVIVGQSYLKDGESVRIVNSAE